MARARPGFAKAVNEILESHGVNGKRLSFRQAERLTGLAPATISELAKGNARTPETVRRFASGTNEDVTRLLLLAGFVPEDEIDGPPPEISLSTSSVPTSSGSTSPVFTSPTSQVTQAEEIDPEEKEWLGRMGRALAKLPPGRERQLWKESLRRNTELIETFLDRSATGGQSHG